LRKFPFGCLAEVDRARGRLAADGDGRERGNAATVFSGVMNAAGRLASDLSAPSLLPEQG
jgi:hypothetical protein